MNKFPLIEKILLLESKLGERCTHTTFDPIKFDSFDTLKVHEVGEKIAQHLGLPPLTFFITFVSQKENIGGNIKLDNNTEIFIEIDTKFKNDNDFVSAILAHEICHKYLQINNIKLFPDYENEMLTDAATIYTGLGKLSLNGCEKEYISRKSSGNTITTTTSTQKVGYMNRQQFAFVYRLVCEMRRTSKNEMLNGLNSEASNAVREISIDFADYFNPEYFSNDLILREISNAMNNEIRNSQKLFANFKRNIRVIQENILKAAEQDYNEFHIYTKNKTEAINISANKTHKKEEYNFIENLVAFEELKFLKTKLIEKKNEINKIGNTLSKFINYSKLNYLDNKLEQNFNFLLHFECPICKEKMRINENKLVKVKCSKCNYSFIIDATTKESFNSEQKINKKVNLFNSWIKKIRYYLAEKINKLFSRVIN